MNLRERLQAILKSTTADIDALVGDSLLVKAADGMQNSRDITDSWQAGEKHASISAEEVKTGPQLAADGDNTARMNSEYSSNARQAGTQADAERMQAGFRELRATAKAQAGVISTQGQAISAVIDTVKGMQTLLAALLKAEDPEETAKAEDEKDDYTEKAKARSSTLVAEAKALLAKANTLRKAADEMDDEDDKAAAKAIKSRARASLKLATLKLSKARRAAYICGDVELRKSITEIALKSDVELYEDEDLEKAEDDEDALEKAATGLAATAKADEGADAAAKAKTDDKGHQADRQDPASGNQAAAAKAAGIDPEQLQTILKGMGALQTSVNGLLDFVSGQSKTPPTMAKAVVVTNDKPMLERIAEAQENGMLTAGQAIEATSLAQSYDAVVKGHIDKRSWQGRLELAPAAVRALYADMAA